jgi:hypothetical protein
MRTSFESKPARSSPLLVTGFGVQPSGGASADCASHSCGAFECRQRTRWHDMKPSGPQLRYWEQEPASAATCR